MTAIIPRRLFDEPSEDESMQPISKDAELRANGLIRAAGIIPIEYNEKLKAMARKQGRNADQLLGEILVEGRAKVDQWEAQQEAERLKMRFGDNWLEILNQANP